MNANRYLIKGAHVFTMDPDLGEIDRADVLIEDSQGFRGRPRSRECRRPGHRRK